MTELPNPIWPKDVEGLLASLMEGTGSSEHVHVWRDQSNIEWVPYPGIYRRILNNGISLNDISEALVNRLECDLFCEANGLGYYGEAGGSRLDLMVKLQHCVSSRGIEQGNH